MQTSHKYTLTLLQYNKYYCEYDTIHTIPSTSLTFCILIMNGCVHLCLIEQTDFYNLLYGLAVDTHISFKLNNDMLMKIECTD